MESTLVSVELIEVGARRRQLKEERVIALAKSIEENGLQTADSGASRPPIPE
jgi:hypothetical protein